jgi:outer membrane protein OmpA-like peptidoglycan-associated protein
MSPISRCGARWYSPTATVIGVAGALLLAACASSPPAPEVAMSAVRRAIVVADQVVADQAHITDPSSPELAEARIRLAAAQRHYGRAIAIKALFVADREGAVAAANAHDQWSVEPGEINSEHRAAMQLRARVPEADIVSQDLASTQADANNQRQRIDITRDATADGERTAADLEQQIVELQVRISDHGLMLTLGDVLFVRGTAILGTGGTALLNRFAEFLNRFLDRTAQINGYTDSVGSDEHNQRLSQRRAEAVKSYLVNQGVGSSRLTASGKGESSPVGNNGTFMGREQNRRVEVIIGYGLVSGR